MATIGLPKSFSLVPVARQSARAPEAWRPTVVTFERSGNMVFSHHSFKDVGGVGGVFSFRPKA